MRKIIKFIAIALCVICLGTMVACGGDNGGSKQNELSIFVKNSLQEIATANKMAKAFKAKMAEEGKEVEVTFKTLSDSTYNKDMLNAIQSKSLPDLVYVSDVYLENWAMKGTFENLDPYFENANFDFTKHDEAAFEISKCVGKNGEKHLYMVPRTYDQPVIAVNVDLWHEVLGDDTPVPTVDSTWTWSKLMSLFADMRTAMDAKYGKTSSTYLPMDLQLSWQAFYNPFVRSFGGYVYNSEDCSVGMSSKGTRAAVTKLKEMLDNKYIASISGSHFVNNKAIMYVISRPYIGSDWEDDFGVGNVAFLPIPVYDSEFTGIENGTSYYTYGTVGFAMNSGSKNKDLAYKYLEFTLSEEGQTVWAQSGLSVPTMLSIQQDENAVWKKPYEFLNGVDQSAFTFTEYMQSAYTRIPATYARTGDASKTYESGFYNEATSVFTSLGNKSVDSFISMAQDQLTRFIA